MKFKKKPVVIEAVRWTGANCDELHSFCPTTLFSQKDTIARIPTLEGTIEAKSGDWIIKGVAGEFYPCKPEIFEALYENAAVGVEV